MKKRFFWSILGALIMFTVVFILNAISGDTAISAAVDAFSSAILYAVGIFSGYGLGQDKDKDK